MITSLAWELLLLVLSIGYETFSDNVIRIMSLLPFRAYAFKGLQQALGSWKKKRGEFQHLVVLTERGPLSWVSLINCVSELSLHKATSGVQQALLLPVSGPCLGPTETAGCARFSCFDCLTKSSDGFQVSLSFVYSR